MQPFDVPGELLELREAYPRAEELRDVAKGSGLLGRAAVARLWMSEGIPYAFRDYPAIYESVRSWLGLRLEVDPKTITVVGSARIGESLSPKNPCRAFGPHSDLDLVAVSDELFQRVKQDFIKWSDLVDRGELKPENKRQSMFWSANLKRCPKNIERGFLDARMIPSEEQLSSVAKIYDLMWRLGEKLEATPNAPKVSKASLRVYRSWEDFVRQVGLGFA